jgi:ubiquitin-protein ligase
VPDPAGSPRFRRLRSELRRLRDLEQQSDYFFLDEINGDPPEEYVVRFHCRGIVAPGRSRPVFGDVHQVRLQLGAEFPLTAPQITWLTPLFHPNVSDDGRRVCISVWSPTQYLDTLCNMLWRMIQYRNFDPFSALRVEAAEWAASHLEILPIDSRALRRGADATTAAPEIRII